jgi:H+/Cl- antiporter ClcA
MVWLLAGIAGLVGIILIVIGTDAGAVVETAWSWFNGTIDMLLSSLESVDHPLSIGIILLWFSLVCMVVGLVLTGRKAPPSARPSPPSSTP